MILEADLPVDEVVRRWQGFYQRYDFVVSPHPYIHPPYRSEYPDRELVVLPNPRVLTPAEYEVLTCCLSTAAIA